MRPFSHTIGMPPILHLRKSRDNKSRHWIHCHVLFPAFFVSSFLHSCLLMLNVSFVSFHFCFRDQLGLFYSMLFLSSQVSLDFAERHPRFFFSGNLFGLWLFINSFLNGLLDMIAVLPVLLDTFLRVYGCFWYW